MKPKLIYLDDNWEPTTRERATQVRIIETLPDGSRRETYATVRGKPKVPWTGPCLPERDKT